MSEWQEQYLTSERSERVGYCSCHECSFYYLKYREDPCARSDLSKTYVLSEYK